MTITEALEFLGAGLLVGTGWYAGETLVRTVNLWINVGFERYVRWRWERANPQIAAAVKAANEHRRRAMEQAVLGEAEGPVEVPPVDNHGQYV